MIIDSISNWPILEWSKMQYATHDATWFPIENSNHALPPWLMKQLSSPQEAISHLQALEDELVEAHRATIQNMLKWTKEDASLLAMTNEVDYDQDGT